MNEKNYIARPKTYKHMLNLLHLAKKLQETHLEMRIYSTLFTV